MSDSKVFMLPDAACGSHSTAFDPNLLFTQMMNGNGGFGGNNWIWIIFMFFLFGWRNNGWGNNGQGAADSLLGTGYLSNQLNNDTGRELLMLAIKGNGNAISQLASTLNCDINSVKSAINSVQSSICQVGNLVGMSVADVKNSITTGNMSLAQQLASCCCDLKTQLSNCCCGIKDSITRGNYENLIATMNQTNQLQSSLNTVSVGLERGFSQLGYATLLQTCDLQNTINAGIQRVIDGQCAAEKREMLGIIAKQNEDLSTYKTASLLQGLLTPISAALSALRSEVDAIKCKQPDTATVPYLPFTAVPNCVAWNYGLNNGFYNGGYWS